MDDQRNEEHIPTMTPADERIVTYFGPKIRTHLNTQYLQLPYVVHFLDRLIRNTEGSHYDTFGDIQNANGGTNEGIDVSAEMTIMEHIKNLNDLIFYLEREIRLKKIINENILKNLIRRLNLKIDNFPIETGLTQIQVDDETLEMGTLIGNLKDIHLKLIEILFKEFKEFGDVIEELESFKDTNLLDGLEVGTDMGKEELKEEVLKKYKEIITKQINEIWDELKKKMPSIQQEGGSLGSRKKLTKKKNKKYNFKKNTQKNKIIKKSRTKKVSKLHKRLSKNKFIKKSRTKKVSKLYKRKSVKK